MSEVKRQADQPLESSGLKKRKFVAPKSTNPINAEGFSECFQTVSTSLYVSLAPCHLSNPINGVKAQHLDPLVMTYFSKAKGVVLSYFNIKFHDDNASTDSNNSPVTIAKVTGSSPFTFLWITVDLLIWRPQVGDILEGYVYMQTASHIGLLLNDTFNASIKKYNIPSTWQFIPNQVDEFSAEEENKSDRFKSFGYWIDENGIKVVGKLGFTVKTIHTTGKVVSVEGTLISPGAEIDAQPVYQRRTSTSVEVQHKRFDEIDNVVPSIPETAEIPEPETEQLVPTYTQDSDDDVVNKSDSDSDSD